ncbi:MAG TPA: glycosyltransferase [Bacteroidota bacterium]|nr:glycosyltransferase [Bacteroidota bacterium]
MKKALTLIIAEYNAPKYLEFVFAGLQRQTFHDFEVIIADDGSGSEISNLIERYRPTSQFPIRHVWQEDKGFRKNAILNAAVRASETDYLVFIDGDCLPHKKFLDDHRRRRADRTVLCGRRVNLSKEITEKISVERIATGKHESLNPVLLLDGLMARSSNLEDGLRIGNDVLRTLIPRNKARILGCNFSVEKSLLEEINGFNEEYQAPGIGEDTDIAFRLSLVGAKFNSLRYLAVLYHLYHPATKVGDENRRIFERVVREHNPRCAHGLTTA